MRIYIPETKSTIDKIDVYLTLDETEDFRDSLISDCEIDWDNFYEASNINGSIDGYDVKPGYLEFYIYTERNINSFPEQTKKIIIEDKL